MRLFLTLLLALLIPFNAAFAATNGICDVLEGKAQHGTHPGHHAHQHDHDATTGGDTAPTPQQAEDHHHSHAHALFAVMLPTPPGLDVPPAAAAPARPLARGFVSALPTRLDRPPRAASRA